MSSYSIRPRRAIPALRLVSVTFGESELVELGRASALATELHDAIECGEGGKVLRRLSFALAEALDALHRAAEPGLYRRTRA